MQIIGLIEVESGKVYISTKPGNSENTLLNHNEYKGNKNAENLKWKKIERQSNEKSKDIGIMFITIRATTFENGIPS